MNKNITKEVTITSKGQITLPIEWRRSIGNPSKVRIENNNGELSIKPSYNSEDSWGESIDFTQFNPKGVPIGDMIKALEELEHNDRQNTKSTR